MNPWQRGARYWRTAKHLSVRQLGFKVLEAVEDVAEPALAPILHAWFDRRATLDLSVAAALAQWRDRWEDPQRQVHLAHEFAAGRFQAAGQTAAVAVAGQARADWAPADTSPLFRYALHYGHDIEAAARTALAEHDLALAELARDRMLDWIDQVRIGDPAGWRPYPIAVRIGSWARALWALQQVGALSDSARQTISHSLAAQIAYLRWHLEHAIAGNHLLRDYVGLLVGGTLLGDRALVERAEHGLRHALSRQWLADGGFEERCPGYHALAMADLAEALAVARGPLRAELTTTVQRAAHWLAVVLHPDGTLPRLGDTSLDQVAEPRRWLSALDVAAPAMGTHWLHDSGLLVWRSAHHHLVCRLGPLGAEHQPGHAHADIGAFEWAVAGERIIVDTGVPGYDGEAQRPYARSAPAHNVAVADGRDHAEMWASFRVGWRPHVHRVVSLDGDRWQADLWWLDDFREPHLPMRRQLTWRPGELSIDDTAVGAGELVVRLVLHPLANAQPTDDGWVLRRQQGALRLRVSVGEVRATHAPVWQRMGAPEPSVCLEIRGRDRLCWQLCELD